MDLMLNAPVFYNQLINIATLCLIQYSTGWLAKYKQVKVNYTRKINHFTLFFVPILIGRGYAIEESFGLFALGAVLALVKFVFYIQPIRKRIRIIAIMFNSFDRPEDRPYTLLWLTTQTAAGYLIILPMSILFRHYNLLHLALIPIIIYGIGDGLAEPVGVTFGRYQYAVKALFTNKKYVRTLEGSACVFFTSLIVLLFYYSHFSPRQLAVALATIPLLMTLAEAISPHTWDSPLMFLVGYLSLFGIARI